MMSQVCQAVEIESATWGFDNHIVVSKFNILTVMVSNPTPAPFEGRMRLHKLRGDGSPVDAVLEEPLYLAPFTSRSVQFYPYVLQEWEDWKLSCEGIQGERVQKDFPRVSSGEPAVVTFVDPTALGRRLGSLPYFNESQFPPLGSATDTLKGVVLDHVPKWEESRRQAFLDWVEKGGELHLFKDETGAFPKFSDLLSPLNLSLDQAGADRHHVGAGVVVRHSLGLKGLTREYASEKIVKVDDSSSDDKEESPNSTVNYNSVVNKVSDFSLLTPLREMTRANHNWVLIYGMAVVYILMIFPGGLLVGKFVRNYRIAYLFLLGSICLFSLGFSRVGRRGYGEQTSVNSVAIVRPLAAGTVDGKTAPFDVTQWTQIFVTTGNAYTISHHGSGALYSTAQDDERVSGTIFSGVGGRMENIDIPPYSSRGFTHRTRIQAPSCSLKVESWTDEKMDLKTLVLNSVGPLPELSGELYVLFGNRFYKLDQRNGKLQLGSFQGDANTFLQMDHTQIYGRSSWSNDDNKLTPEQQFARLAKPLMARTLEVDEKLQRYRGLPSRQIRVYLLAPMTSEFFIDSDLLPKQSGRMLYCIDLFRQEKVREEKKKP